MSTSLLQKIVEERSVIVARRDALLLGAETDERTAFTAEEETEFRQLLADDKRLSERIADLAEAERRDQAAADATKAFAGKGGAIVRNEPTTYAKGSRHSYFRDLAKREQLGGNDADAQARLQRHAEEIRVDLETKPELRANMNRTDGTGGDFVPPLWLMDQYIGIARAGRITADLCRKFPLPAGTDSINIPSVATGSSTAELADGGSVSKTDMTTGSKSAAVTTIAGQQVFAMQLLDQSPINFDEVVFSDLIGDLALRVDVYVISKASIGILNVTGINAVTYTDATPTVPEMYPKFGGAKQLIHTTRFLPPQAIVMTPTRWEWELVSLDSNSRPLVVPSQNGGSFNAFAGMGDVRAEGSVGYQNGLPVYVDPNIPSNLGAGTNEDRIIVARFDDLYLYEGAMRARVLFETDADTLSVRLQVWEYLAFMGNRFPKSIAVISGTGLVQPTF